MDQGRVLFFGEKFRGTTLGSPAKLANASEVGLITAMTGIPARLYSPFRFPPRAPR